ncbi:hypothetical protein E2562_024154 [Oryza meyeriana var. granulata]|uniref:Uncharacterized protein n=1 Tax=Oryza meyeriana var. granulata TaxID=110450 RepID=A0A6G1EP87_9ORYZ|nr:hypothetical protein E2562_024154 [Oryza meyeriana var. granulata]
MVDRRCAGWLRLASGPLDPSYGGGACGPRAPCRTGLRDTSHGHVVTVALGWMHGGTEARPGLGSWRGEVRWLCVDAWLGGPRVISAVRFRVPDSWHFGLFVYAMP